MELIQPNQVFKHGVSATMIETWSCKRKFYNRYIRGLKTEGVGTSARFGKGVDIALNGYFGRTLDEAGTIAKFKESYEDKQDDGRRTHEAGEQILKLYFKTFPRETDPFKVIDIQKEFIVDIGAKAPFHGILDLTIQDNENKDFLPFDNKTTTSFGDSFKDKFELSSQTGGYIFYTKKTYGDCFRMKFNVLVPQKTKPRCERFDINLSVEQLAYWQKRTVRMIDEIVTFVEDFWDDPEYFTLSDSQCTNYNSKCIYFDLCKYCDNLALVEGDFIQRKEEDNVKSGG